MPVIDLSLSNLREYALNQASEAQILETLPYLGLDIESTSGDTVSVEYSPNRPDYSSEVGIARSLVGLLGVRTGLPEYTFAKSALEIDVPREDDILKVRPYIFGISCEISVDELLIKQLIAMQEDLHNGLGRKRSLLAIGIHNAEVITPRIRYFSTRDSKFSFIPLGSSTPMSIEAVMERTEQGIKYGSLIKGLGVFPLLQDSAGHLLSMPPIINGEHTRLREGISKLFIDVTATDQKAGDTATAIMASMLSDRGGRVLTVDVKLAGRVLTTTPEMTPSEMRFDLALTNHALGYSFSMEQASEYLARCRLSLGRDAIAKIPRFRADIVHPIDLAEEVALGYGTGKIEPLKTETSLSGAFNSKLKIIDKMIELLIGLGLTELWNLSLVNSEQVAPYGVTTAALRVDNPKSQSYEYLRSDLTSSLLAVLKGTTDQEYPQKIFEVAPVFNRSRLEADYTGVSEDQHVGVLLASSDANYTMARSALDAFLSLVPLPRGFSKVLRPITERDGSPYYLGGRSAEVVLVSEKNEEVIGVVGEIAPSVIERHGLQIPISGFELNLEPLIA